MSKPVYLDYNATTPIAPEVAAAIRPWLETDFGNPSSGHAYGQQAHAAVGQARFEVATLIGADATEIVFTGNATEANNLALLGVARAVPDKRHLIVGAGETARQARERLPWITRHLHALRERLWQRLSEGVPGLMLNGHPEHRLPNTLHVSFPGVSGRDLLAATEATVAASVGSACHSHGDSVSGVLAAWASVAP